VSCWPVAAGLEGVVRAAARSENSDEVFADCSWIFAPTGPFAKFWVIGWFLTALAAAEASTKIVSFASLCFQSDVGFFLDYCFKLVFGTTKQENYEECIPHCSRRCSLRCSTLESCRCCWWCPSRWKEPRRSQRSRTC